MLNLVNLMRSTSDPQAKALLYWETKVTQDERESNEGKQMKVETLSNF